MRNTPAQSGTENDYSAGYARVMWYAERARMHGWRMSERQLVHEIIQRERAALIRECSNLPIVGREVRSAAWNPGQADALRDILREQREQLA
jgi:predicted kinase